MVPFNSAARRLSHPSVQSNAAAKEEGRTPVSFHVRNEHYLFPSAGESTAGRLTGPLVTLDEISCNSGNAGQEHSKVLPAEVRQLITNSISPATQRAYTSDLGDFRAWGGHIPSDPEVIATYLAAQARTRKVATIARRLASISMAHETGGYENPTKAAVVQATMRGLRRHLGTDQRQAQALLRDGLFAVLGKMGERPKDIRDRALLLVGFATAMRRSELVALDFEDVEFVAKGALVTVRRSKVDQEGEGRKIAVPFGRTRHCPVDALRQWLTFAEIETGAIFLSVNKHGHVLDQRISGEAVAHVVKTRAAAAGYDPEKFSGHSLRSGFATSAAEAGASFHKIKQTTGHRSDLSLGRYLHDIDLFNDAAAARLL